jgi:hypothetical protein
MSPVAKSRMNDMRQAQGARRMGRSLRRHRWPLQEHEKLGRNGSVCSSKRRQVQGHHRGGMSYGFAIIGIMYSKRRLLCTRNL